MTFNTPFCPFTKGRSAMTHQIVSIRLARATACAAAIVISIATAVTASHAEGGPLITPATLAGDFRTPLDSTPNPNGDTIYFTAQAKNGKDKGVFTVPAKGGKATVLFSGAPFASPSGIAMSLDGRQIFVADAGANGIFSMNREFVAARPNRKWVSDITVIPTAEGDLYLASTLDLWSRMILRLRSGPPSTSLRTALHVSLFGIEATRIQGFLNGMSRSTRNR